MPTISNLEINSGISNTELAVPFLNLRALYQEHRQEFQDAIHRILDQAAYIGGAEVQQFETNFARWINPQLHALGCANGTEAITLAALALDLNENDEAILPAMTFAATAEGFLNAGVKIKLVDIRPDTYLIDIAQVEKTLTAKVRVLAPVHLYGQMPDMEHLQRIAKKTNCFILEDAAQAHGSRWNGNSVGHYGDIASYSFYPGKNLGAFGDGGAIVSRDQNRLNHCKALANHGGIEKYVHQYVGYNSRLDGIQAAVLNVKLKYIDAWNEKRRQVAKQYLSELSKIPGLTLPVEHPLARHTYHLFVVQVEKREDFMNYLKRHQIDTGIHYPTALHQAPAFSHLFEGQSFPNAEQLAQNAVSLPMCPTITPRILEKTVRTIRNYFGL